eukprot:136226-Rhodomonas_salina.1
MRFLVLEFVVYYAGGRARGHGHGLILSQPESQPQRLSGSHARAGSSLMTRSLRLLAETWADRHEEERAQIVA